MEHFSKSTLQSAFTGAKVIKHKIHDKGKKMQFKIQLKEKTTSTKRHVTGREAMKSFKRNQ